MLKEIKEQAKDLAKAVVSTSVKAAQSWHYPPVRHDWCVEANTKVDPKLLIPAETPEYDLNLQKDYPLDEDVFFLQTEEVAPGKKIRPHIYRYVFAGFISSLSIYPPDMFSFIATAMNYFKPFRCTCSVSDQWNLPWIWSHSDVVWHAE